MMQRPILDVAAIGMLWGLGAMPALAGKTKNVVLIVSDGLRWQEVLAGSVHRRRRQSTQQ